MEMILTAEGQTAATAAKQNGQRVDLSTIRLYRSNLDVGDLPFNPTNTLAQSTLNSWVRLPTSTSSFDVLEDFTPLSSDIVQINAVLPSSVGSFDYDIVALYLSNGTLFAVGAAERLLSKVKSGAGATANIQKINLFFRFTSASNVINITRSNTSRPYSFIGESNSIDSLGKVSDNLERIYRITRSENTIGSNPVVGGQFNTYLAHAGFASFDSVGKTYQKKLWIPDNHMLVFGYSSLIAKLVDSGTIRVTVPPTNTVLMEMGKLPVEYILSAFAISGTPASNSVIERAFHVKYSSYDPINSTIDYTIVGTSIDDPTSYNSNIGVQIYLANTDFSAQTALRAALKSFLEMQYDVGRRYESDASTHPNTVLLPYLGYTTYWTKLEGVVNIATSVSDGRFNSPGQLWSPDDYDSGSQAAPVVRATNMWIRYDPASASSITYSLSKSASSVDEGSTVTFSLETTGLSAGALVAWTITGIPATDLVSPSLLTGNFTIDSNGTATLPVSIKNNQNTDGSRTMRLKLTQKPTTFQDVVVNDTSKTAAYLLTYKSNAAGTINASDPISEGSTVYLAVNSTNVPTGTIVYPKLATGTGYLKSTDLDSALPSSLTITASKGVMAIQVKANRKTDGDRILGIEIYSDAARSNKVGNTALIGVDDTSTDPTYVISFSPNSTGSSPYGSSVNEGAQLWTVITTTNVPAGTVLYPKLASNSQANASDLVQSIPATVTLAGSEASAKASFHIDTTADETTEGAENLTIEFYLDAGLTNRVAWKSISIADTSVPLEQTVNVPAPQYSTVPSYINLLSLYTAQNGAPDNSNRTVTFIIDAGTTMYARFASKIEWQQAYGTSGNLTERYIAIYGDEWPENTEVILINYGRIYGAGGRGGTAVDVGSSVESKRGQDGGAPIEAHPNTPIRVENYGTISGGGGGGGASGVGIFNSGGGVNEALGIVVPGTGGSPYGGSGNLSMNAYHNQLGYAGDGSMRYYDSNNIPNYWLYISYAWNNKIGEGSSTTSYETPPSIWNTSGLEVPTTPIAMNLWESASTQNTNYNGGKGGAPGVDGAAGTVVIDTSSGFWAVHREGGQGGLAGYRYIGPVTIVNKSGGVVKGRTP